MKKSELIEYLDTFLQVIPSGLCVNGEKTPTPWSVGYYNGLEIGLQTVLRLVENLDSLD